MMIARRTFLLGFGAGIAAPTIAKMEAFTGPISTGVLDNRLGNRWAYDFLFSSMATGEELRNPDFREHPIQWTFTVRDHPFLHITINPRSNMRWVCAPGGVILIRANDILRATVEPCHTETALTVMSSINEDEYRRNPLALRRQCFSECYHWKDGKPTLSSIHALDVQDEHLVA